MTAERLREAAAKLRSISSDATTPEEMHPWGDKSLPQTTVDQWASEMEGYLGGPWGVFAGVMSPPVALAFADLLDRESWRLTEFGRHSVNAGEVLDGLIRDEFEDALAVADAILGEA